MKKSVIGNIILTGLLSSLSAGVTFNLNTSTAPGFTDSTNTIVLRGSFNGWGGDGWAMTNAGGDYWTYTSDTLSAGSYEFKYVSITESGEQWESTDNRAVTVTGEDNFPMDYWEAGATAPYTETDDIDAWFRVSTAGIPDFNDATGMYIAGTMNGWSGESLTQEADGSDFWSAQYPFTSGTVVEYKFLNGTDGWEGIDNRTFTANTDTTLAWVYFNNTPPTDEAPALATFNLNTSTAPGFTDSTATMVIRGSFNGWGGNEWAMTNVGGDYWTYTTMDSLPLGEYMYKYVFINATGDEAWESTADRPLNLTSDHTPILDYWESDVTPPYEPTDSLDVWFRVSTAGIVAYEGDTMHIAGSMNGWSGTALTHEGDDFWSGQYSFSNDGAAIEYKFLIGTDGWESNDNRTANITGDTTLAFSYWDNAPPTGEDPVTKTIIFSVDLTEWLDEDGATGMPVFSVARGDQMQVRGGFNGWNCDDPADCEMTRTPGTNIFSLAVSLTSLPDAEQEYKYYMQLDSSSIELFESTNGDMYSDMGWEDSPQFGGANRIFTLGADDGTGFLELELSGYYDLPAGAVIPAGQEVDVTFTVDMTGADADGFSAEDTVSLVLKDKWLNYLQGLGDNSVHVATANGDGTYSATVTFTGPFPWHMIYTWSFYDVDNVADIEEGGGFGFGRFRARYQHANSDNNCEWENYTFPMDEWQKDPPLPLEDYDPESVCISLYVPILYNGGFEDGITGWSPYPEANASYVVEMTGANIYNSDAVFEAYEGDYSLKQWGQYNGAPNYGSFGQWLEVGLAGLEVGSQPTLSGMMFSHADDWIGQGVNSAYLAFYYYDDSYGMVGPGWEMTDVIDASSPSSEWLHREVTGTVPEGTVWVWAGVEYYQASNADNGSVYTDMLEMDVSDEVSVDLDAGLPGEFKLLGNFPNPFNPVTKLSFDIDYRSNVVVTIYNILGNEITTLQNGEMNPGRYSLTWNATNDQGKNMPTGMYLYKVTSDSRVLTGKMLLMK